MGKDQAKTEGAPRRPRRTVVRHEVGEPEESPIAKTPPASSAASAVITPPAPVRVTSVRAGQRKVTPAPPPTSASGIARATKTPTPRPEESLEEAPYDNDDYNDFDDVEAKTDIICVLRDGRILAMVDRNTMKWENALSALIRDGHITLTPEQEKLVQMEIRLRGHPSWFHLRRASSSELSQWTDAGNPVLKAGRAKAGQGKTTSITANRIHSLTARLGRDAIPIPDSSAESTKLEKSLSAEYKLRKENGTLPATDRQVAFAKELAARCSIAVPREVHASSKAASDFIDRCQLIAPPSERQLQRAQQVAGNKPIPEEALRSTKGCSDWIERTEQANLEALVAKHRSGRLTS